MAHSRYAELFRTESREHIAGVNRLLLELETDTAQAEAIEGLFRAVHTLKGMSAAMGYGAVDGLAHAMESVLDTLRGGTRAVEPELLDALFRGADALEAGIDASAASGPHSPLLAAATDELRSLLDAGKVPAPPVSEPFPHPAEPAASGATVGDGESATPSLRVRAVVAANAALPGVRAFLVLRRARELGRVGELVPEEPELQQPTFRGELRFSLATEAPAESVREQLFRVGELADVEVADEVPASPDDATPSAPQRPADGSDMPPAAARSRHVRVEADRLDAVMGRVGELVVLRDQLVRTAAAGAGGSAREPADAAARLINELRDDVLRMRLVPVAEVFERFPRLVRDTAQRLRKKVRFSIEGGGLELDRSLLDRIGDPIVHLLRNAVDHGIELPDERLARGKPEEGRIRLSASRERDWVVVRVADDGRGINRERVVHRAAELGFLAGATDRVSDAAITELITRSGLSTRERVTELSGRGVGLDVAATEVRSLGGTLDCESAPGGGTTFTLRFPASVGLIRAVAVACGGGVYLVPVSCVAETVELRPRDVEGRSGRRIIHRRGEEVPLFDLHGALAVATNPAQQPKRWLAVVIAEVDGQRIGIEVDGFLGHLEVVSHRILASRRILPVFQGAAMLPDGQPALILDVAALIRDGHIKPNDMPIHAA